MVKAFAPALALVAAVPALWGTGAAAGAGDVVRGPDLNGDGRVDRVVVGAVAGDPEQQELVAVVRGVRFTARMPLHSFFGLRPLRFADVDGDGRDEVVVTESVGANTELFTVWGLGEAGLRAVTEATGRPLVLAEGGGVSAISGYGCEGVGDERRLVVVRGEVVWSSDPMVYAGERVAHTVRDGVATATATTPVLAGRDAPAYRVDLGSCA
ncbi:VCBS repeat-containing protein [Saccharothrix sp. 6-C]|uniref:FG-GAP repeat domain-containing protein n=1 Tax=Saccharothrix sp. 6-C TaxID=2781735 RepID=UPI0019170723|nr:VCBS repeat-containing protein [Saccharothrix sp. 6-C]QQQ74621.1 VCBS repeat-containing protein [Saccharothrix sp. 6-C]